jgi:hypothetical protein
MRVRSIVTTLPLACSRFAVLIAAFLGAYRLLGAFLRNCNAVDVICTRGAPCPTLPSGGLVDCSPQPLAGYIALAVSALLTFGVAMATRGLLRRRRMDSFAAR